MKKIVYFLFLLLYSSVSLKGQLAPVTNQYILNPLTINPASAGDRGALNIAAFYRKQWVGIAGSPVTMTLACDAPIMDSRLGIGLIIMNDKVGVTKETRFLTSYAYRIRMNEGILSFGIGAGIITTNTAWSDLVVVDKEDSHYLSDSRVFALPDFSFGTYYTINGFFAGISIPRLLGYNFNFDKNRYSLEVKPGEYSYMFNTGYLFSISPRARIQPSTLVTFTPGHGVMFDLNAHVNMFDRLWAGLSYRSNSSMAGLFQFAVNDQLKFAYTYDFDFGKIGRYSNGSHEIMVRYELRFRTEATSPLNL